MALHQIPLNFLIYEESFIFFFISVCVEDIGGGLMGAINHPAGWLILNHSNH
jgi:hypothetical protein